jgi:hypothetical protein
MLQVKRRYLLRFYAHFFEQTDTLATLAFSDHVVVAPTYTTGFSV